MDERTSADETHRRRKRHWWKRALVYVVVIYIVWCGALYFMQGGMMFPADMAGTAAAAPLDPGTVVLEIEFAPGAKTVAWLVLAPGASAEAPKPVVAFFHGNAELIHQQRRIVAEYTAMGRSVLLIEYRGYGNCDGTPSEKGIVPDSLALIELAAARPDVDAASIAYHGRSIGGAIAAQVARQREPAALVLESSFTHAGWFAWRYGVPPILVTNPFRTRDVLPRLTCPILLFHGEADRIIPVEHSRTLADLTPGATLVTFPRATHNGFPGLANEEAYWNRIRTLMTGD